VDIIYVESNKNCTQTVLCNKHGPTDAQICSSVTAENCTKWGESD